jgi:hypothetical protein
LVIINSSGNLELADADSGIINDSRVVGSSTGTYLASETVEVASAPGKLIPVKFSAAPAAINNGEPVYLSGTAGEGTLTAPTSSGSIVFLLGILQGANGVDTTPNVLFQPNLVAVNG